MFRNLDTLASSGKLFYGTSRGLILRLCRKTQRSGEVDVTFKRSFGECAFMAGRGEKRGSFGGIGTPTTFGDGEKGSAYPGLGSGSSGQQEYPKAAASTHASSAPRRSNRGDPVVNGGHENGDRQNRAGRGRRNAMDPIEALGRCMTAILRHRAADYDVEMKGDGFVLVADLLKLSKKTAAGVPLSSHSEEDVRKAVAADGKQRFGLKEESGNLFIRANQGHTIKTVDSEQLLTLITSPSQIPVCVHGTYERFMSSIWQEGLKPMKRNHVHFATGLPKEDGVISGMRATAQVLIYLDVETAMADGMKLYISANNVVLTDGLDGVIPTKYFKKVLKNLPDHKQIPLFPPTQ